MRNSSFVLVFMILGACEKPQHAANDFYSQMLDEIVSKNCIGQCAPYNEQANSKWYEMHGKLAAGEIDTAEFDEYEQIEKSRIKEMYVCEFDLYEKFGVSLRDTFGAAPEQSIRHCLAMKMPDEFQSLGYDIVDTLITPLRKRSEDFKVDYIKLLAHVRTNRGWYRDMKGSGIFSFSKPVFNRSKRKALVYWEYVCGGKCGSGVISLFELDHDQWRLKDERDIWNF